jgi:threonine dehydratase
VNYIMLRSKSASMFDPAPDHRLRLEDIATAAAQIPGVFLNAPQYDCEPLSAALGCALTVKVETLNPIRSFKGRGASYLIARLAASEAPLVGASAGNWGQALAYACRTQGQKLILFASPNANPLKIARMRALGADVRLEGEDFDAAKFAAEAFTKAQGLRMVADGLDAEASIGAGTIARELLAEHSALDAVLIPLGNGAMLTGMGRWIKAASPHTMVIGVQATGADAMEKSWRSGTMVVREAAHTIADGIGVRVPIPDALQDMRETVDEVLLVDDDMIRQAMRLVFQHAGIVTEPSGAAGVAAVLAHRERFAGKRIATVLCGGNATAEQISWMT